MKQMNLTAILCSLIVGIAIVVSSFGIHDSSGPKPSDSIVNGSGYKPLMTIKETAEYLNLTEAEVKAIIISEDTMLRTTGVYSGKLFPVIRIESENYVSIEGLKEWLLDSTLQRKEYK
ncbi:DNA-binding protein [Paenibacillus brevis]|uniref:DNA-binding protein n=2 Tax=Paenibacillus TaxID=44249 RepID=A0ABS6FT93_9BACL|nr:DNA-binding protein [Paenibacillus brevis]MBU5672376.1 DNA-binding protein [Paenibacillus brevis]